MLDLFVFHFGPCPPIDAKSQLIRYVNKDSSDEMSTVRLCDCLGLGESGSLSCCVSGTSRWV